MITFSKYKSATIEKTKRIVKVLQFGAKTAKECAPFGIDSQAIENLTAIYAETTNAGESVVIGYINENALAKEGEMRLFSTDKDGTLKSYLWLKNNGNIELNGNQYTAVRFQELQTALNNQLQLINAELAKISLAGASVGMIYTPTPIQLNLALSESKSVKLK